jgi:hypothetical protein
METATVLTMIFTLGIVWGGCVFVITLAIRRERRKASNER